MFSFGLSCCSSFLQTVLIFCQGKLGLTVASLTLQVSVYVPMKEHKIPISKCNFLT